MGRRDHKVKNKETGKWKRKKNRSNKERADKKGQQTTKTVTRSNLGVDNCCGFVKTNCRWTDTTARFFLTRSNKERADKKGQQTTKTVTRSNLGVDTCCAFVKTNCRWTDTTAEQIIIEQNKWKTKKKQK